MKNILLIVIVLILIVTCVNVQAIRDTVAPGDTMIERTFNDLVSRRSWAAEN